MTPSTDEENDPTLYGVESENEIGDDILLKIFSLEYMKNVIDFYDTIDETTGKPKKARKVFSIDLDESVTHSILDAFENIWKDMETI